jgi:outer membrane protein OmpA-like peptidoglycan-associated protein
VTGNYPENIGPDNNANGSATTDLFMASKISGKYQLKHFDEPVNSIFTEADGVMNDEENAILFVSDRPGHQGDYHKKGWQWNGSYWGNTDIYVSLKNGYQWGVPVNLGKKVNTEFAERTPWISADGLKLFISSNGFNGRSDLDVYYFTRNKKDDWTNWEGPFPVKEINTDADEWCYREIRNEGWFARGIKLGFTPTSRTRNGGGFVFENNFRSGYTVRGLQSMSQQADQQYDIFKVTDAKKPAITLPEILFDYNQATLKRGQEGIGQKIADLIEMNNPKQILIEGHTDQSGSSEANMKLSLKRAETIRNILVEAGIDDALIQIKGLGESMPVSTKDVSENRRVEIFLF